jgi:hypothetical protein
MKTKTAKVLGVSMAWLVQCLTSCGLSWPRNICLAGIAGAWLLGAANANADGCFLFHWNKEKDIAKTRPGPVRLGKVVDGKRTALHPQLMDHR